MSNEGSEVSASRATSGSSTGASVSLQTVEIFFSMSPGASTQRKGIEGAEWHLFNGTIYTDYGTTGADGKVTLQLAPGQTNYLEILGTQYEITLRSSGFEAVTNIQGQRRRLRMLGYQIGHAGTDGNGVTPGSMDSVTERSILDFQADANEPSIPLDGNVNAATRNRLTNLAGG